MKLFIGADHRGFELKEMLRRYLSSRGHDVEDVGAFTLDPTDDYPPFAHKVAKGVVAEPGALGILLCGSGLGMDVVANKVRGARASIGYSAEAVVHGRANDNLNIITLPADALSPEDARARVDLFLMTPFSPEEKYLRRQEEIAQIESQEDYG